MKLIAKVLVGLGYVWVAVSAAFILKSYGLIVYFDGVWELTEILSPFNIWNWLAVMVTVGPGFGLIYLGERLKDRVEGVQ